MPQTSVVFSSILGPSCSGQVLPGMGERGSGASSSGDLVFQEGRLISGSLEALMEHLVPTVDYYPDVSAWGLEMGGTVRGHLGSRGSCFGDGKEGPDRAGQSNRGEAGHQGVSALPPALPSCPCSGEESAVTSLLTPGSWEIALVAQGSRYTRGGTGVRVLNRVLREESKE